MSQEKERLLARKARIESRLAAIAEAEAKKREKEDKRRAELAGQAVLKHAKKDAAFARELRAILDAQITGVRLRALFDLPPKAPQRGKEAGERTESQTDGQAAPAARDGAAPPGPAAPESDAQRRSRDKPRAADRPHPPPGQ